MDPETYRAKYTEPLGSPPAQSQAAGGKGRTHAPQLPEEAYYSRQRPHRRSDGLTLDLLTKDELLAIIEEAGAGRRDTVTGVSLRTWLEEKDRLIAGLEQRLAAADRRAVDLEGELTAIRSGRSWRVYLALRPILHKLGGVLNVGANRVRRLARRGS